MYETIQEKSVKDSNLTLKCFITFIIVFLIANINIHKVFGADLDTDSYNKINLLSINQELLDEEKISLFANIDQLFQEFIEEKKIEEEKILIDQERVRIEQEKIRLAQEKEDLKKNALIKYVSSNNGLNIRGKDWKVIKTLPLNSEVTVLKEQVTDSREWDLVLYNDEYAYAYHKYLSSEKKIINTQTNKKVKANDNYNSSTSTSNGGKYLGTFSSTAYCNCKSCCGKWSGGPTASGAMPQEGITIAVDPRVIPLGSKVSINGKVYIAQDTGSAIKGNKIDIYFSSHSSANAYGRRKVEVYLVN